MDEFGLINMNGRMYDPILGRFLSPDPIIANPNNTQDYNRYSYVVNNPLMFTDPSGYRTVPAFTFIDYTEGMSSWGCGGGGGGYSMTPHIDAHRNDFAGMGGYYYDWETGEYIDKATGQCVDSQIAMDWLRNESFKNGEVRASNLPVGMLNSMTISLLLDDNTFVRHTKVSGDGNNCFKPDPNGNVTYVQYWNSDLAISFFVIPDVAAGQEDNSSSKDNTLLGFRYLTDKETNNYFDSRIKFNSDFGDILSVGGIPALAVKPGWIIWIMNVAYISNRRIWENFKNEYNRQGKEQGMYIRTTFYINPNGGVWMNEFLWGKNGEYWTSFHDR